MWTAERMNEFVLTCFLNLYVELFGGDDDDADDDDDDGDDRKIDR